MKHKICRTWLVLILAICVGILSGLFAIHSGTQAHNAFAATSSAEDNLTFSLINNSTEYKVQARNKQIKRADIPSRYNGLPVTEIADSGFTNCTNLEEVRIPVSVTRVGNNAFANCRNLTDVQGMPKAEHIGNNAFAMCVKLNDMIIPNTLKSMGSTVFRNNPNKVYSRMSESEMTALNANWKSSSSIEVIYGNELVLSEVTDEDGTAKGYSISMQQNLNTNVDFVLGDTYNGLPLLEIEPYAFYYSSFKSFTLRHGEINSDVDAASGLVASASLDCNHEVNVASAAFFGMESNYIDLLVDVTFLDPTVEDDSYFEYENGRSIEIFSNSTVRSITLPNNISYIPRSAFTDCLNLREIKNTDPNIDVNRISPNITAIGSDAFSGCKSLINLYIGNVTTMGNSVFNQWGDSEIEQTLHFYDLYEAPVGSDGYDWDTNWLGTLYQNVQVKFVTILIILDKEGGKEDVGTSQLEALLHRDMPQATAPEKDCYTFQGYYTERNGQGKRYYDQNMNSVVPWDRQTATVLYAYWVANTYRLTLDKQGGIGGSDEVVATYGASMPSAIAPTKTGFQFLGYWTQPGGESIRFYDENMISQHTFDDPQVTALYARWKRKVYKVTLDYQSKEIENNVVKALYGEPMPETDEPLLNGYTLHGIYTEQNGQGQKYYNPDGTSYQNWNIDCNEVTLYAYWTINVYHIEYIVNNWRGDEIVNQNPNTYTVEDEFNIYPTVQDGYQIDWALTRVDKGTAKDLIVFGNITRLQFSVTYVLNGGENDASNPVTINVEDTITLKDPTNEYIPFLGWYLKGKSVTTLTKIKEDITLIAKWDSSIDKFYLSADNTDFTADSNRNVILILPETPIENCCITLTSAVHQLEIYGKQNISHGIYIEVLNRTTDYNLKMYNVSIEAPVGQDAIYDYSYVCLNLYTYGSVKIVGGCGKSGYLGGSGNPGRTGIVCGALDIHSADDLTIEGGKGGKGGDGGSTFGKPQITVDNGGNGGKGGFAVDTGSNYVCTCSNVKFVGGNGGEGGNGSLLKFNTKGGTGGKGSKPFCADVDEFQLLMYEGSVNINFITGEDGTNGQNGIKKDPLLPVDPIYPPGNPIKPTSES